MYGLRRYGKFSSKELKSFLITVIIIGFIIGFNDRRETSSIDSYYFMFMLVSIALVAFSLFLKLMMQRAWMYYFGQNPEYKYSINSLLIGIVIIFASEGHLWFLAPGFTMPHLLQAERIGKWRYGLKYLEHGRALMLGILGLVFFNIILKFFESATTPFLTHAININIAISIYSMLPIPENDGIFILYARRWLWVFTLAVVVLSAILLKLVANPWIIIFFTLILATAITIAYNLKKQPLWFS